jgi:hypothetical protein
MITNILNIFRTQARQHKAIRAFYYGRNYELGSGKDIYPLMWLEDPITGRNHNNTFTNTLNFSILFIPDKENTVAGLQNLAFSIGLNIIERIKKHGNELGISIQSDWTYLTLSDYYDDNACGCRFSLNFTQANMQNLCLIDEQFDEDKQFEENSSLNDFDVSPANNCEIFTDKFPVFDLKTRK